VDFVFFKIKGSKRGIIMLIRKKTYKILPKNVQVFNDFFHTYLYPNQIKHGSKLIGRWVNESCDEITALWEYKSFKEYQLIEEKIRSTQLHQLAKQKRKELGQLFLESSQEFLSPTGNYRHPQHIVSVSGYITNEQGEVLLVKSNHRPDTYQMPSGQVEEGETLEEAIHREVFEETGVKISIKGITGIYQNVSNGIFCVVFHGEKLSGELQPAPGETTEVLFTKIDSSNIDEWIIRPQFKIRLLDAINSNYIPYEAFNVKPFDLITRYEGSKYLAIESQ
jgi:8-oxo-dGTP diphosphatase